MDEIRRKIAVDSADAVVVQGQPRAAELFEHVQEDFTLPESPEEHGHRADIEGLRAQPEQMADDPLHLRDDVRIYSARSGTVISSSFSTART